MTMTAGMNYCSMKVLSSFNVMRSECEAIPTLGPAKYSEADQLENPERQMTRVIKDVLRVGRWKVGHREENGEIVPVWWNVTHDTLDELVHNFQLQKGNGVTHPLCWGHVESGKPDIDPREAITQIDELHHVDGTLWIACYVSPVQSTVLQNQKRQVSIGSIPDLEDGEGRVYPGHSLAHVGIVEHPVVPGQGEFIQLSLSSATKQKAFKESKGSIQMAFTLENWVQAINSFLPDGSDIPTEGEGAISEENADEMLALVMSLSGKQDAAESEDEGSEEAGNEASPESEVMPDTGDTPALEELPVEMRNKVKADPALYSLFNHFNGKLGKATQELSLLKASERKAKREAFNARLTEMGKAGLDAVTIQELKGFGEKQGHELSLLKPYEKLCDPALMNSQTVQLANNQPNNPSVKKAKSQEDIDRLAKML